MRPAFLAQDHAVMDAVNGVVRRSRRQLLGRARHRPAEALHDAGVARRRGTRADAQASKAAFDPRGLHEPRQGVALTDGTACRIFEPDRHRGAAA